MTNPKTYYEQYAQGHDLDFPIASVLDTGKLPKKPSETDWAVYWLMQLFKRPVHRCLDVGCADLIFLRSVESLFAERWGVDIAASENWNGYPEIFTSICDLNNAGLPFAAQSFDAIVMLMVLEHVFNPFHAIREVRRVCKSDGYIIIAVPNIAGWKHRMSLVQGRLPITATRQSFTRDAWDGYHLHCFTQASLDWLFHIEGLRTVRWTASGRMKLLKRFYPSFIGSDLIALCQPCAPSPGLPPDF